MSSPSSIPAQPPVLPPIQRVASVSSRPGSVAKRPTKTTRSTTSPVFSSPKRWGFENVPEAHDEDDEDVGQMQNTFADAGIGRPHADLGRTTAPILENPEPAQRGEEMRTMPAGEKSALGNSIGQDSRQNDLNSSSFMVDFDENFKLNSLELNNIPEDTPISPTQPAEPMQAKRSRSPQKHWALPPLATMPGKDLLSSKRPISDGNASSDSSLSSANRSQSLATINPELTHSGVSIVQLSPVTTLKPSKQRKSILNPLSLLARRRVSHDVEFGTGDGKRAPPHLGSVIRGAGVHDFDKPRGPRRNLSTNDLEGFQAHSMGDVSPVEEYRRRIDMPPWTTELDNNNNAPNDAARKQSMPAFREHFDDDDDSHDTAIRRETLANPAFLARVQDHLGTTSHSPSPPVPATSKAQDDEYFQQRALHNDPDVTPLAPAINIIQGTPNPEDSLISFPAYEQGHQSPPPRLPDFEQLKQEAWSLETPTPRLQRPSNASDTSRFSFVPGDSSAEQERLMEQAHVEREAEKRALEPASEGGVEEERELQDDEDDQSISDYGEEGSFYDEDTIPGAGIDDDDDEGIVRRDINMPTSARVEQEEFGSYPAPQPATSQPRDSGLGLIVPQNEHANMQNGDLPILRSQHTPSSYEDNDDMYFDDGEFDEPSPLDGETFDESMFDRDIKRGGILPSQQQLNPPDSANYEDGETPTPSRNTLRELATEQTPMHNANLVAYHSALATAAAQAEASGKFDHDAMSPMQRYEQETSDDGYDLPQQPQFQQQQYGQLQDMGYQYPDQEEQPYWQSNDYDDFDPELDLNSDDIAAANAEALAADDSGFYGREFNFYSRVAKGEDGEEISGGYFGTPGKDSGINRTTSMREPILTPITERSEFSRAPSFMSMGSPLFGPSSFAAAFNPGSKVNSPAMPNLPFRSVDGHYLHPSSPAMASPGLKELAGQMGLNHDDMTLKQLMKLRQQTLGTAGLSPAVGHFSSPAAGGATQFGGLQPGTASGVSLSPHAGVHGQGPMPSSPLAGRSANITTSSPAISAADIKIGRVPDHAKGRSLRSSLNAATSSSPPTALLGENGNTPLDDYFSPASPTSPFSYTGSNGSRNGLGLDIANFPQAQVVTEEVVDEYDTDADDEEEFDDSQQFTSSPPQSSSPVTAPKHTGERPNSLGSHPITADDLVDDSQLHEIGDVPTLPANLLNKFASRPPASSATFDERELDRQSKSARHGPSHSAAGAEGDMPGVESVAYVQEPATGGQREREGIESIDGLTKVKGGKWYIERRKTLETGEVLVLGREEVVEGRI
jgi:hypothetical protein